MDIRLQQFFDKLHLRWLLIWENNLIIFMV